MAEARRSLEGKRGRGRGKPPREPELMPAGSDYDTWRAEMMPRMEALLVRLEAEERDHEKLVATLDAAASARALGLPVAEIPEEVLPLASALPLLKMGGGAKTAYQVWTALATRVLRDGDIGAIVRTLHPERLERSSKAGDDVQRVQDADIPQQQRKRMRISDEETRAAVDRFWTTYMLLKELPD